MNSHSLGQNSRQQLAVSVNPAQATRAKACGMDAYQESNGSDRASAAAVTAPSSAALRSDANTCPTPLHHRPIVRLSVLSEASTCWARGRYRRKVPPASGPFIGAAVLVHSLWGNPHDWRWVRGLLQDANVQVITPDLPSHQTRVAGRTVQPEVINDLPHHRQNAA